MSTKSLSRDDALLRARACFASGDQETALALIRAILKSIPHDAEVRNTLRENLHRLHPSKKVEFVVEWSSSCADLRRSMLGNAAQGWQYLLAIDEKFLDPFLDKPERAEQEAESDTPDIGIHDTIDRESEREEIEMLFAELGADTPVSERWNQARKLCMSNRPVTLLDSFVGVPDSELQDSLRSQQSGAELNIVIFGAGPVGLALANGLKLSFKDKINILIVDTRVQADHVKRPYTRCWLTHLQTALVHGVIDPQVTHVLDGFGKDGYLGTTVNVFETLLLLSNKRLGVNFLFQEDPNLSFIDNSHANLIVDATGGRLRVKDSHWEPGEFRKQARQLRINIDVNEGYSKGHARHGITKYTPGCRLQLDLQFIDGFAHPCLEGIPLKSSMFKITGVPVSLYDDLMEFTRSINADSIFYIWPGNLVRDINEILLLINLDSSGLQFLNGKIGSPRKLSSVIDVCVGEQSELDLRIVDLLRFLATRVSKNNSLSIEPPFLYKPYFRYPLNGLDKIYGKPVLPVGDSVFNGHPKMGNGLGVHLISVAQIVDQAMFSWLRLSQPSAKGSCPAPART